MSTGLECEFANTSQGWMYVLQDWDCPEECWDWREYATSYGFFETYEVAAEHLRENHANPGGHSIIDSVDESDETWTELMAEAGDNRRSVDYRDVYFSGSRLF